jgi:signal transduction histidine kinase
VIASNNSGVWNETGAVARLLDRPAYYQTAWFRALAVVTFLSLLWRLHRLRLRIVERHEAEITALNERLMKGAGAGAHAHRRRAARRRDAADFGAQPRARYGRRQSEADAKQTMADVQRKLIEVGTEVRQLSHNLHPPMLKDAGLPEALRATARSSAASATFPSRVTPTTVSKTCRAVPRWRSIASRRRRWGMRSRTARHST